MGHTVRQKKVLARFCTLSNEDITNTKMTEAQWTSKYMDLIPDGVWEVKLAGKKRNTISYKQFAPHQIRKLLQAKHGRIKIKMRDVGKHQKEFDGISLTKSPAWAVLVFGSIAYVLDIDAFYNFCMREGNKVISVQDSMKLGYRIL